jgi:RecJ-like exonuclease
MTSTILTHGDLDGIASGAIAVMAFPGSNVLFSRPSQIHQDLFRLSRDNPDVVLISDIALNSATFDEILRAIERFPSTTKTYWTDHHPIAEGQRRRLSQYVDYFNEVGSSASELVFRRFGSHLPETALRLALYGAIGDYCDSSSFAATHLEDYDKRTLYFEAGILVQALQEIEHQKESRDLVYELALGIQPSAMNDLVALAVKATRIEHEVFRYVNQNARKLGSVGYVLDMPMNGYRGKAAKFAASCTDSVVGISARTTDEEVDLSMRRRGFGIDLNAAVTEVLSDIHEAQGGGHPAAAGATMRKTDFPKFLERLARYVDSH